MYSNKFLGTLYSMNNVFKISIFAVLLSLYHCIPAKGVEGKDDVTASVEPRQDISKEMIEKGFSKGTIRVSKSEGCPYILNVSEYKDNLDPINLREFLKTEVPEKVWVKFASLRMPNRCDEARPVSILKMNKRNE